MNEFQRLLMVAVRFAHCLGDYFGDWMVRKVSDKERLEDIKKELELDWSDISYVVNQNDVKWLVNRVGELEQQNKRYREAIKECVERMNEGGAGTRSFVYEKLIKVLEG